MQILAAFLSLSPVEGLLLWCCAWGVAAILHAVSHELAGAILGVARTLSLGFGPTLWTRGRLRVAAFPGASVDPQLDEVTGWRAALYLVAGPVGSLVWAWLLVAGAIAAHEVLGREEPLAVVGWVDRGSAAEADGFRAGDRVVEVDGRPIRWWSELQAGVAGGASLTIVRGGERATIGARPQAARGLRPSPLAAVVGVPDPRSEAAAAGLRTGDLARAVDGTPVRSWHELVAALERPGDHALDLGGAMPARLLEAPVAPLWGIETAELYLGWVEPGSAAEGAGLQPFDRLVSIDGEPLGGWGHVIEVVSRAGDDRERSVGVLRGGELLTVQLRPRITREVRDGEVTFRPMLGVRQLEGLFAPPATELRRRGLLDALAVGAAEAVDLIRHAWDREPEQVGGPIAIMTASPGPRSCLRLLAMVSASMSLLLAAYNVLPLAWSDALTGIDQIARRVFGRRLPASAGLVATAALFTVVCVGVTISDVMRFYAR